METVLHCSPHCWEREEKIKDKVLKNVKTFGSNLLEREREREREREEVIQLRHDWKYWLFLSKFLN